MFLSKISILSYMIAYKLLAQQKYQKVILIVALKLMKKKWLRLKRYGNKVKSAFMIYVDFESFIVPKDNGKQNPSQQVLYEQV